MRSLSSYRDDWRERERLETEVIRKMTVAESIAELEALREAFHERPGQDEEAIREHRASLEELQARLDKLEQRGSSI